MMKTVEKQNIKAGEVKEIKVEVIGAPPIILGDPPKLADRTQRKPTIIPCYACRRKISRWHVDPVANVGEERVRDKSPIQSWTK